MIMYNLIEAKTMSDLAETLNYMNVTRAYRAVKEKKDVYTDVTPASNIVYVDGYFKMLVKESTE